MGAYVPAADGRMALNRLLSWIRESGGELHREGAASRWRAEFAGWEERLLPRGDAAGGGLPFEGLLRDRLLIELGADGALTCRWEYWTWLQTMLHVAATLMVLVCASGGEGSMGRGAILLLVNLGVAAAHFMSILPRALELRGALRTGDATPEWLAALRGSVSDAD